TAAAPPRPPPPLPPRPDLSGGARGVSRGRARQARSANARVPVRHDTVQHPRTADGGERSLRLERNEEARLVCQGRGHRIGPVSVPPSPPFLGLPPPPHDPL